MINTIKMEYILTKSDGSRESVIMTADGLYKEFVLLGVSFKTSVIPESNEYKIKFIPEKNISLKDFKIVFKLEENGFSSDETLIFHAGSFSNQFVKILKPNDQKIFSRDIIMFKYGEKCFNLAFSSFNRFYTYFNFEEGKLETIFSLEDKNVLSGKEYILETLVIDEKRCGIQFFDFYADILKKNLNINIDKPVPCGWSSWSCIYSTVTEQKILTNAKNLKEEFGDSGATLIQMDDGWQKEGGFSCLNDAYEIEFPSGIDGLQKKIGQIGLDFGIWMAPGLMQAGTSFFNEYKDHCNLINGELITSFANVYPMDLSDDFTLEQTKIKFETAVKKYKCVYFKIDFLINLLMRAGNGETPIFYKDDYSVALYKRFTQTVRNTVGNDVFLLACGAPVGESAGIFDGIRVSPDITWGGALGKNHPGAWTILKLNAISIILRSPYNGKVFINDPDALVLRYGEMKIADDGLDLNENEALLWATTVAFSGGHILINERLDVLPEERKKIFKNIIPPYGKAARPFDFFEYPLCTHTYLDVNGKSVPTQIHILYNWEDEKSIDKILQIEKPSFVIDCHTKKFIGYAENSIKFKNMPYHSTRAICIKEFYDKPFFVYSDDNIYLGAKAVTDSYKDGVLSIKTENLPEEAKLYIYIPNGSEDRIYINDKETDIKNKSIAYPVEKGNIVKIGM